MADNTVLQKIMIAQKVLKKLETMGIKNSDDLLRFEEFYNVAYSNGIKNANEILDLIAAKNSLNIIEAELTKNGILPDNIPKLSLMKIAYEALIDNQINITELPEIAKAKLELAKAGISSYNQIDQVLEFLNAASLLNSASEKTQVLTEVDSRLDETLVADNIVDHIDEIITG